jgi:hypothetical protein
MLSEGVGVGVLWCLVGVDPPTTYRFSTSLKYMQISDLTIDFKMLVDDSGGASRVAGWVIAHPKFWSQRDTYTGYSFKYEIYMQISDLTIDFKMFKIVRYLITIFIRYH